MTVVSSTRQRILEAFETRLSAIVGAPNFETRAGRQVYLGFIPSLGGDDENEAIAILPGEDVPAFHGEHVLSVWPIEVHAIAKASIDRPWIAVERVIADIKRAMELTDRRLGGLIKPNLERGSVRAVEREPGSTTVGAVVPYIVKVVEVWGDPT